MMVRLGRRVLNLLLLTLVSSAGAWAQARFDLPGPRIDIRVTRNGAMLPIASVPNLQAGDKLWLHPDFPADQVAHYLLIASFLRGTTNPPPDDWFTRIETWKKDVREEGVTVTVPDGAQQAILFLAPETGGDYSTLRSAVKGRPGVFVRASQDLTEAGFEQGRIEKYLAAMKQVPPGDPKALQQHSDLLARTLALKPNPDCFKRPLDQQYTCLTQTGTQTLLDDGHSLTVAEALSNGASSDFINAASYTPLAGGGNYSAYVGAIVDLVRLTSSLHVAKYQYIPAIAFPSIDTAQATLDLRLNTAPSFNNPKSVIVIGLPAVRATVAPPLRPVDPKHVSCLLDPDMTLPIEGAPLVFTTSFAHDVVLHLNLASGAKPQDLPLTPDAYKGGLVLKKESGDRKELPPLDASAPAPASQPAAKPVVDDKPGPPARPAAPAQTPVEAPKGTITGTIEGMWGFDRFTGPTLPLQQTEGGNWRIVSISSSSPNASPNTLIVGHPNKVELTASGTACVDTIELEPGDKKIEWKLAAAPDDKSPQPVDLTLNLEHDTAAGSIHLAIHQFGDTRPELLAATTFVEPAKLEALRLHAGDLTAVLTGAGLEQVESVSVRGLTLLPAKNTSDDGKTLALSLPNDAKASALKAGEKLDAEVHLHDGRTLPVKGTVLAPRPAVTILSRR